MSSADLDDAVIVNGNQCDRVEIRFACTWRRSCTWPRVAKWTMGWPGAADCRTLCSSDRRQKEFLNLKPVNERPLRGSRFSPLDKTEFSRAWIFSLADPRKWNIFSACGNSFVSFRVKSWTVSLLTQHRYRFVNPWITRGPYFGFCGQQHVGFPAFGSRREMTRRKRRMLTLRNNNKKMENCEENCVELILFGDSGHFVLTSILHVIALWAT